MLMTKNGWKLYKIDGVGYKMSFFNLNKNIGIKLGI